MTYQIGQIIETTRTIGERQSDGSIAERVIPVRVKLTEIRQVADGWTVAAGVIVESDDWRLIGHKHPIFTR